MSEDLVAFSGEVLLMKREGDDEAGFAANFRLHGAEGRHPLKQFRRGTRFQMVLVELSDDEEAVNQRLRQIVETQASALRKKGSYAKQAGILCKIHDYHRYLLSIGKLKSTDHPRTREAIAAQHIYDTLGVRSRKEIDHGDNIEPYKHMIMQPYFDWLRANPKQR